jgi:hypothetical protein
LTGGTRALIPSHERNCFQSVGRYPGSNHALPSRRGAIGDETPSQAMTTPSTRSSTSGEPRKLTKPHEVQQLPLYCCPHFLANGEDSSLIREWKHLRLPCLSTRSHIIGTSTDVQQLVLYLHLHHLSNRKCKANKFTGVQHYALRLHPPPLPNRPSKVMASASPICGLVKTRTMMGLLCLHPQALVTFLLSSWLIRASLLTPLAVIANPPLHLTTSRRM